MRVKLVVRAVAVLLVVAGSLSAQTLGEIAGFVRDSSGALLAGAAITVANEATGHARTVTTSEAGAYVIALLPPGRYSVSATLPGFRAETTTGLHLGLGDRARASFALQVGQVEETLEVIARAPLIVRDNASLATTLDQEQLVNLPSIDRNYLAFTQTSARVSTETGAIALQSSRQGGERGQLAITIAGQRKAFTRYTLDGIENTDVNFNTYIARPSIDALREVKLETGIYSAQYGRAVSQIIVGTKSGTNELHGSLFEFHRNEHLAARPWRFDGEIDPAATNQFGFTVGGPLVRNRLFFFSNAELLRERTTLAWPHFVVDDEWRSGDFSQAGRMIFDPLTRVDDGGRGTADPFPNQVIPSSRQHPIALSLLEFYPAANTTGGPNYSRATTDTRDAEQYLQRFDFQESAGSTWSGRFSHGNERNESPVGAFPTQTDRVEMRAYQWALSNTRSLGARTLIESRFGYSRSDNDKIGHFAFERDVLSELGIEGLASPDPSAWNPPSITFNGSVGGTFGGGGSSSGPWSNRNRILQLMSNASLIRGSHSIRFGGEVRRDHYNQLAAHSGTGELQFSGASADPANSRATGEGFADFLLGTVRSATRIAAFYDARLRANSLAFYLQDTWRVTPKLTVDMGLRYEYTPPFHDTRRNIINTQLFDMGVGPGGLSPDTRTPTLTRPGSGDFYEGLNFRYADEIPTQAGDQFMGRRLVAADKNDWAPRIGLAYSPSNEWTIRVGAGVFYSQDIGNPRFEMSRNLSGRDRHISRGLLPDSYLDAPWAARGPSSCGAWDGICISRAFTFNNVFDRKTPYVTQWIFDIQRQLSGFAVLQAGYHGSSGHRLERMRPFNAPLLPSGPQDGSTVLSRRPWAQYGTVQQVDGVANSNYHALNLRVQSRFSSGTNVAISYSWAKSIDDASAIRNGAGDRLYPVNNYDLGPERGLSSFHIGQRFVTSLLYELPVGPGRVVPIPKGAFGHILGGWQVSSVLVLSEGSPYGVSGIDGFVQALGTTNYWDGTGIAPEVRNPTPERFWNKDAFSGGDGLKYRFSNLGRSHLRTPGLVNWDFALLKNVSFSELRQLQIRFEAYNFANHPNWTDVENNPFSREFGVVQNARQMRTMQFGIKYIF